MSFFYEFFFFIFWIETVKFKEFVIFYLENDKVSDI